MLAHCDDLLEGWGGHALAAGLSVRRERLPELRARMEALVREHTPPGAFTQRLVVDAELPLSGCTLGTVDWLERLSPFGLDNSEPLYRAGGLVVESSAAVGGGKHMRVTLRDATGRAEAVGFGLGALAAEFPRGTRCQVVYAPTRNEWQGESRVQLKLKGVRAG
jgi:single-stranded-DNA-specific exonuclease